MRAGEKARVEDLVTFGVSEVSICGEQPNGQLLAMYGVAYPDNPFGAALTQDGGRSQVHSLFEAKIEDDMLDAMLREAQMTCERAEVRSLILRHEPVTRMHQGYQGKLANPLQTLLLRSF